MLHWGQDSATPQLRDSRPECVLRKEVRILGFPVNCEQFGTGFAVPFFITNYTHIILAIIAMNARLSEIGEWIGQQMNNQLAALETPNRSTAHGSPGAHQPKKLKRLSILHLHNILEISSLVVQDSTLTWGVLLWTCWLNAPLYTQRTVQLEDHLPRIFSSHLS